MNEITKNPVDALVDIELDEEQLARLDELIEQHSTPSHRLTREGLLLLLIDKGRELVEQGESLLPFLESPEAKSADDTAPPSAPAPGHETLH